MSTINTRASYGSVNKSSSIASNSMPSSSYLQNSNILT